MKIPFRNRLQKYRPNFEAFKNSSPILVILSLFKVPRKWIKSLYGWVVKWSGHKNAQSALAGISFAESSFFPLPPDPLLMAMVFAKPKKWLKYAAITLVASVLGGLFGYLIGSVFFDSIGDWLLSTLHLEEGFKDVENLYLQYSFWIVFVSAISPIPYKIFTIAAGVFKVNLIGFLIASIIGRGLRFFAVAGLASFLGHKYKDKIEQYIDLVSLGLVVLLVLAWLILR